MSTADLANVGTLLAGIAAVLGVLAAALVGNRAVSVMKVRFEQTNTQVQTTTAHFHVVQPSDLLRERTQPSDVQAMEVADTPMANLTAKRTGKGR